MVVFSAYADRGGAVLKMLHGGMRGIAYMLKGCDPGEFLDAVNAVVAGRVVIDGEVSDASNLARELLQRLSEAERPWVERALDSIETLSKREMEIASKLAASQTVRHIAESLVLTPKTVENHRDRIYSKLGLTFSPGDAVLLRPIKQDVILVKSLMIYELRKKHG